jgi:Flp pilus assembly protein TadD
MWGRAKLGDREARRRRGKALRALQRGDAEAAAPALAQHVEAYPDDTEGRLNYGVALYQLGKYSESLVQFEHVLGEKPDLPQAWLDVAAACNQLGLLKRAEEALSRAAVLAPARRDLHYNLALLRLKQGRVMEAMAEAETELSHHPNHPPARALVGMLEQQLLPRG